MNDRLETTICFRISRYHRKRRTMQRPAGDDVDGESRQRGSEGIGGQRVGGLCLHVDVKGRAADVLFEAYVAPIIRAEIWPGKDHRKERGIACVKNDDSSVRINLRRADILPEIQDQVSRRGRQ